jgi:hypothetical protein
MKFTGMIDKKTEKTNKYGEVICQITITLDVDDFSQIGSVMGGTVELEIKKKEGGSAH